MPQRQQDPHGQDDREPARRRPKPTAAAILHTHDHDHWHSGTWRVRADRRYRGIDSRLLAQCLHLAHQHGAKSLAARTDDIDRVAARLLLAGGLTQTDTLTIHHRRT
ncbi:GNAT family N-acetyltransferase [Streptomyces djakartensis]|uniref:GNAT family N-acetyltransferase n=1 Tax=Streptomyces djakartensis TaxID=68193 RepID=UPI0034DE2679